VIFAVTLALLAGSETRDRFVTTVFAGLRSSTRNGCSASIGGYIWGMLFGLSLAALPAAIGVAVLRYCLYEIDLLINRTLVYGLLTVTLVALYFGGIVLLQRVSVVLTGEQFTVAVVASTLLIAALFNPLRRGIQSFIDRRFYPAGSTMPRRPSKPSQPRLVMTCFIRV
jgi:hypothetical protein